MKGFALGLALKQRRKASRKSPVTKLTGLSYSLFTTRLRHFSGHDCRKVIKHVLLKSYRPIYTVRFCRMQPYAPINL